MSFANGKMLYGEHRLLLKWFPQVLYRIFLAGKGNESKISKRLAHSEVSQEAKETTSQ